MPLELLDYNPFDSFNGLLAKGGWFGIGFDMRPKPDKPDNNCNAGYKQNTTPQQMPTFDYWVPGRILTIHFGAEGGRQAVSPRPRTRKKDVPAHLDHKRYEWHDDISEEGSSG